MRSKKIAKILGIGLSVGLVFALLGAIFVAPAAADQMKWGIVNTPSWEDNVIVPGSDIFDWDVGGEDGDIIYATGHIGGGRSSAGDCTTPGGGYTGLTVSFYTNPGAGSITVTHISSTEASFSGTASGSACPEYFEGGFTAVFPCWWTGPSWGNVWITGEVTQGITSDEMTFNGKVFLSSGSLPTEGTTTFGGQWFCADNFSPDTDSSLGIFNGRLGIGWWRSFTMPRVWKSEDGGVTWSDIMGTIQDAANLPGPFVRLGYGGVAIAPDDEEWLAIAGEIYDATTDSLVPAVVASKDGGDNFSYAGQIIDGTCTLDKVFDIAVSPEVDGIHNIALAGLDCNFGSVYRLKAGTWLTGAWENTRDTANYPGWDNGTSAETEEVVAVAFSPNFDIDDTIVCLCVGGTDDATPYLQSGIWESTKGSWNDEAGFPNAVQITSDGDTLLTGGYLRSMGFALPEDYDGSDPGARAIFLYVNSYNVNTTLVGGYVFRLDNTALSPVCGPPGDPLLASMDVHGDADTGKLMIGEYIQWDNDAGDPGEPVDAECCTSARVWHTEELDFCCPQWDGACKDPSGAYLALVGYTPDGSKAYASTSGAIERNFGGFTVYPIGLCDESAFSVSLDEGVSFNQLGIIDTDIDYLSDVAVCPDCGTIYLSSVNVMESWGSCCDEEDDVYQSCCCDSVWRSYDDGATWERIFHGDWSDGQYYPLLLRLPCDAIEDCCDQDPVAPSGTVYLGIQDTDEIYYSRDCGQCWNNPPATKDLIQDFAVESENIVHLLFSNGKVSSSTQYGRRWSTPVDTKVGSGHSITSCCEEGFVVVGGNAGGKVAWSDDGGETWTRTDALPAAANHNVHVACDPVCENIIYAAVWAEGGGIYRTDVTSGAWDDLAPLPYGYTGIVVAREGTLYASTNSISVETGGGSYIFEDCKGRKLADDTLNADETYSGVARNLTPCDTACCGTEDWDYLFCGMSDAEASSPLDGEYFINQPSALRICGCLSADTNSVLWAIDVQHYDVTDGKGSGDEYGSLWSYEDCAAKAGPDLTAPADGAVLDCEACAGCGAAPFTLKWERMCLACSYDVQIMDEDGNLIVEWVDKTITGDPPEMYVDSSEMFMVEADGDITIYFPSDDGLLECGNTYTWKVREANTSCECVHSPWSETWSFTVAVGTADAIKLLAPVAGALGVPIQNIGFSWTSVPDATTYSFVLSPNAALTGALASQDLSSTAFNFVGPLDYDKAYYWQIKAWKDSQLLTTSAIGVFNTGSEPVTPPPPVVVEPTPAPVLSIPPAEQITPTWIYAIIGIGAALAVVVIVLIVRTRRP